MTVCPDTDATFAARTMHTVANSKRSLLILISVQILSPGANIASVSNNPNNV